ncbi:MAG: polysaccharide lyase family 8 super-sandwich domain-containing protein, partial [Oscillospiraceae bacterium]
TAAAIASRLLQNESVQPRSEYLLSKVFTMDKAVSHTEGYSLGISMSSTRTYGHELINEEGKRTWNIGDGMVYLYLPGDMNQYGGGYWATVDPTRLAGTTVEHKTHGNGAMDRKYNKFAWVGGSTLGTLGAVGMQTQAIGDNNTRNGAQAQKSWFLFGSEVVALGAGITGGTANTVETIIENRRIQPQNPAGYTVTVNGEARNLFTAGNAATTLENVSTLYLDGQNIGYYFPTAPTIEGLTETRQGSWNSQGTGTGTAGASYATFWFNHGVKPSGESYAYIMLPGASKQQTAAYAQSGDVEILANTTQVQAAYKASLGATTANFWVADAPAVGGISVNNPASVTMVRNEAENTITLSVSDPTQKNVPIAVTVAAAATEVVQKADNISVEKNSPYIRFTVDTTGQYGGSSTITFRYNPGAKPEVVEVQQPNLLKAELFTRFDQLSLPATVQVLANNGRTYEAAVEWLPGDYNRTLYGVYTLEGNLKLPGEIANSEGIKALQKVQVGEISTGAAADLYVRGGSYNAAGPQLDGTLYMKNENDASYRRKILLRFDLAGVPQNLDRAYVTAQLTGAPAADFERAELYQVDSGWNAAAVTYNTFPARLSETPVAGFTMAEAGDGAVLKLEVTGAVKQALAAGEAQISFELSIPTATGQNSTTLYSSRTTVPGAQKPALTWEKDPPEAVPGETGAEYLLRIAEGLAPEEYLNYNAGEMQNAIDGLRACLQNPNTTAGQLAAAESRLNNLLMRLRRIPKPIV